MKKKKCLQVIGNTLKGKEDREKIAVWGGRKKRKRGRKGDRRVSRAFAALLG